MNLNHRFFSLSIVLACTPCLAEDRQNPEFPLGLQLRIEQHADAADKLDRTLIDIYAAEIAKLDFQNMTREESDRFVAMARRMEVLHMGIIARRVGTRAYIWHGQTIRLLAGGVVEGLEGGRWECSREGRIFLVAGRLQRYTLTFSDDWSTFEAKGRKSTITALASR